MNCLIILNFSAFLITTMASSSTYLPPVLNKFTSGEYINSCNNKGGVQLSLLCPPFGGQKKIEKKSLYGVPAPPNPLVEALLLSNTLNLTPKSPSGYNHLDMLPLNPYLALLLSHYGQYLPIYGKGRGLYGYTAANNYHNNKPFGAYKVYEDNDS